MPAGTNSAPNKIVAVLEDLFFTVKINEAAKRAGLPVAFVKSEVDAIESAKAGAALVILDLTCTCVDPLALVKQFKSTPELKKISLIGYLPHVQGELKQQAHDAGCDMVLARSAFSQNLPQIFNRYAER
jgi:CheY-like chemotaxis protein